MTDGLKKAPAKASSSRRRAYSTPRLVRYGSLRCLTTSGTAPGTESGSCVQNKQVHC